MYRSAVRVMGSMGPPLEMLLAKESLDLPDEEDMLSYLVRLFIYQAVRVCFVVWDGFASSPIWLVMKRGDLKLDDGWSEKQAEARILRQAFTLLLLLLLKADRIASLPSSRAKTSGAGAGVFLIISTLEQAW